MGEKEGERNREEASCRGWDQWISRKRLLRGGAEGAALLPQKLGACPEPTCLSCLLSTHILTSSLDSPRRWVTHSTWGVTRAEAAHGSLPLECLEGGSGRASREGRLDGLGLHSDRVEEVMLKAHARLCPCPPPAPPFPLSLHHFPASG